MFKKSRPEKVRKKGVRGGGQAPPRTAKAKQLRAMLVFVSVVLHVFVCSYSVVVVVVVVVAVVVFVLLVVFFCLFLIVFLFVSGCCCVCSIICFGGCLVLYFCHVVA